MIYAPELIRLYPWFSPDRDAGTFTLTGSHQYRGYFTTTAQGDYKSWSVALRPGAYTVTDLCMTSTASGIAHVTNGGADLATIDEYVASNAFNQRKTATGVALTSGEFKLAADTKHASSSGYELRSTFTILQRTGD